MVSFRLEESSSLRRCSSSLVASDVARATSYKRLSQSMRLTDIDQSSEAENHRCKGNRSGWRSLLNLFSHKKKQNTVESQSNKRKAFWVADPHRRWPVQGW